MIEICILQQGDGKRQFYRVVGAKKIAHFAPGIVKTDRLGVT